MSNNVLINEIHTKLTTILREMRNEVKQLLKKTWVFFDNKHIFYDAKLKAFFPDCNYYVCSRGSDDINMKGIPKLNWDYLNEEEVNSICNRTQFPMREGGDTYFRVAPTDYKLYGLTYKLGENFKYMYCNKKNYEGKVINFPIARMSKNMNAVECLIYWIKQGLIPKDSKFKEYFKTLGVFTINYDKNGFTLPNLKEVLHDNQKLVKLGGMTFMQETVDKIIQDYLECDNRRASFAVYDSQILYDINRGHWEVDESINDLINGDKLIYRNPVQDIKQGGVVAIDFGTKSTIVVYQENSMDIVPMRVGADNLNAAVTAKDYENPTVMELLDIQKFLEAYNKTAGRPQTKWEYITVSHSALNQFKEGQSKAYYTFLSSLKQWCTNKTQKMRLKDASDYIIDLPTFLEIEEDVFNPVEIYAYYLGLYINNMINGIYTQYLLSYPVSYDKETREQLIKSFEKGLKKSLPNEILENEKIKFSVQMTLSEPAGYAITALEEYSFEPENDEKIYYAVFDFGGGTTDFDFGFYRQANDEQDGRRHHYAIEQFGSQGDRYLGGENILELLAFSVFKNNADALREQNICFVLPPEQKKFAGSEILLSDSQEAKYNTIKLMNYLRPLWEQSNENNDFNMDDDVIKLNLFKSDGTQVTAVELKIDTNELAQIIKDRIERGVKNFFEALRVAFGDIKSDEINKINIFLAGNSSKSVVLHELFEEYIQEESRQCDIQDIFEVFPPLGTDEAYAKMAKREIVFDRNNAHKPTGKTGVAFGIIKGRKSGKINIINRNNKEDEQAKFGYYVGDCSRRNKFDLVITPNSEYDKWKEFAPAEVDIVELFYTTNPMASTGDLDIAEATKVNLFLDEEYDDRDTYVFVRPASPDTLEYMVAQNCAGELKVIEEAKTIQLS